MIYLLITAWLWWNDLFSLNPVSRNNQARQAAQAAYQAGNYRRALTLYVYLSRTTTEIDPAVRLNLGHAYFQLKQYQKARPQYETLLQSDRADLRTAAATQLGVLACLDRDSTTALSLFKRALLENPENEPARYNFELIKRYYSGRPPAKNWRQPLTARQPKTIEKPRLSGAQVEQSARQDELLRRFQRLNLSEAQALQLLDAMQSNDLPYTLTQSARHSRTKPAPDGNRW